MKKGEILEDSATVAEGLIWLSIVKKSKEISAVGVVRQVIFLVNVIRETTTVCCGGLLRQHSPPFTIEGAGNRNAHNYSHGQ